MVDIIINYYIYICMNIDLLSREGGALLGEKEGRKFSAFVGNNIGQLGV